MDSYVIFPQTAWINSDLGFAGIHNLTIELKKRDVKFKISREYQAIIFKIPKFNKNIQELITKNLPEDYEIPVLLRGHCTIFSRNGVTECVETDNKFQKLMRDAHLLTTSERKLENIQELSLAQINKLCNNFARSEHITMAFIDFDIEQLFQSIQIAKEFKHKLAGILVDIKCIWFALDYDLVQAFKNSGINGNAITKFKRYIYINNAIVRIRALWEKLIGLAILLEAPSKFDKILSSKSVRSKFIRDFKDSQKPVVQYIWDYLHSLETFENRFRTPELHKIGRTIRWAARERVGEEMNRLLGPRNDLNTLLRKIFTRLVEDPEHT